MSHDHHHGSCCSDDSHHKCCSEDHCHDGSCDAHHEHSCCHEHDDFYSQLIQMADEAWMEVLKCKIKDQIKEKSGTHLDELAKIVSDSNHNRWKHKLEARHGINDYKNKVRDFFNQKD